MGLQCLTAFSPSINLFCNSAWKCVWRRAGQCVCSPFEGLADTGHAYIDSGDRLVGVNYNSRVCIQELPRVVLCFSFSLIIASQGYNYVIF